MPYYKNSKKNYGNLQKKKWASYMKEITPANTPINAGTVGGGYASCVINSTQDATPTPTIIKVKHCKVSFDFFTSSLFNQGFVCLMFVPQGVTPTISSPVQHPEWVMAWRGLETSSTDSLKGTQVMLGSKLSRNLNSGDSIVVLWSGYNIGESGQIGFNSFARFSCVVRNN